MWPFRHQTKTPVKKVENLEQQVTRLQATLATCKTIAQRRKHWLVTAITAVAVLLGFVIIANRRPIEQAITAWAPWLTARSVRGVDAADAAYKKKGRYKAALRFARPLAEQGDARAQALLGLLYVKGRGVPQDDREAMKWFRRAADQGDATAQLQIGIMYYDGRSVPQDYSEAARWYQLAAERGNPEAEYNLGIMYAMGVGMPQDNILAHMWFNLAAAHFTSSVPRDRAARNRDAIARRMSPEEIAQAQELAREWKPRASAESLE